MLSYVPRLRVACLVLFCASAALAQRDLGTITGTVTDSTGGVVADAKVVITERETGQVYETTTNANGEFTRPALKPSTYVISVSAPGFKTAQQRDILLNAGD